MCRSILSCYAKRSQPRRIQLVEARGHVFFIIMETGLYIYICLRDYHQHDHDDIH